MNHVLNVLVACEESGAVRDEFRKLGHNAWSCDLQPCDPASPYSAYHVQGDVLPLLTRAGANMYCAANGWDLLIGHPPCTYLANSGVTWLFKNTDGRTILTRYVCGAIGSSVFTSRPANAQRVAAMHDGAKFFVQLWNTNIPHVAIENPIMHQYARRAIASPLHMKYSKPNQIIQPWMFGHEEQKATCLWLRGLPNLVARPDAAVVKARMMTRPYNQRNRLHFLPPSKNRAKLRSKTFPGIALAMAVQWSEYILHERARQQLASMYAQPTGGMQVPVCGASKP